VTGGQIRGQALGAGAAFKGIPFAAPPVGELRWRVPAAVTPWEDIRDATKYSAPCSQVAGGWNDKIAAISQEDCLYLNVWAPEWPSKSPKAVMFWIHGGANMGGSTLGEGGIEPTFDGQRLAEKGVVVVTTNYRLGIFGFLAHPELTAESPHKMSGNYGILDLIAALKWVNQNIARFGGDPQKVTIFGQSAGGHDVGLLLTSPLAKGLFHRAIEQSGTVILGGRLTPPLAQVEQAGIKLAEKMGAPASGGLKHMRGLSATDVLKASPPYGGGGPLRPEPNVDGYVLPRLPAQVFRSGSQAQLPLLIGSNARERALEGGAAALSKAIDEFFGSRALQARKLYSQAAGYPPHGDANAQYSTDTVFRCASVAIADWHSARNPTWQYEFSQAYEPLGAAHSWELQYVFGNLLPTAPQPVDRTVSDQVMTYWTNFAKTADPNGGGLPSWPRHDARTGSYLEFTGGGPVVKQQLRKPYCDLFQENLKIQD
jgi:para-nitrobenzyl esterase